MSAPGVILRRWKPTTRPGFLANSRLRATSGTKYVSTWNTAIPGLRGDLAPGGGLPARSAAVLVVRAFAAYGQGDWETCDRRMAHGCGAWGEAFTEFVGYVVSPAFSYRPADPASDAFLARLADTVLSPACGSLRIDLAVTEDCDECSGASCPIGSYLPLLIGTVDICDCARIDANSVAGPVLICMKPHSDRAVVPDSIYLRRMRYVAGSAELAEDILLSSGVCVVVNIRRVYCPRRCCNQSHSSEASRYRQKTLGAQAHNQTPFPRYRGS